MANVLCPTFGIYHSGSVRSWTCSFYNKQVNGVLTNTEDIISGVKMDAHVQYANLGRSGLKVSNMCFGGTTFGNDQSRLLERHKRPTNPDEEGCHQLLDKFAELGGNFIDTASIYNSGQSEGIVGSWAEKYGRDKFVIASKCYWRTDDSTYPNSLGLSRKNIMQSVDESLRRLRTDYIDLYQTHRWDSETPIEETLTALNDLVTMGKVRYLGASNVTGWQLQKMVDVTRERNLAPIISVQNQYSLLVRGVEMEVAQVCKNEGIGFLSWSPLKGGWLAGKIKRGMAAPPTGTRIGWASEKPKERFLPSNAPWRDWANDTTWEVIEQVEKTARETGRSMAQVSLRWLLQKEAMTSVIFGANTMQQLEDNLGAAAGWKLTDEQMASLDNVSKYPEMYPYAWT